MSIPQGLIDDYITKLTIVNNTTSPLGFWSETRHSFRCLKSGTPPSSSIPDENTVARYVIQHFTNLVTFRVDKIAKSTSRGMLVFVNREVLSDERYPFPIRALFVIHAYINLIQIGVDALTYSHSSIRESTLRGFYEAHYPDESGSHSGTVTVKIESTIPIVVPPTEKWGLICSSRTSSPPTKYTRSGIYKLFIVNGDYPKATHAGMIMGFLDEYKSHIHIVPDTDIVYPGVLGKTMMKQSLEYPKGTSHQGIFLPMFFKLPRYLSAPVHYITAGIQMVRLLVPVGEPKTLEDDLGEMC